VTLRASISSDWLEVRVADATGVDFVVELAALAADAHQPADGQPPKDPPMGAALERRRRFH
jgi:hypothetical protein